MKIKVIMSIQNAPFENIQPEVELDTEEMTEGLKVIDSLYKLFHMRHVDVPEAEKKD